MGRSDGEAGVKSADRPTAEKIAVTTTQELKLPPADDPVGAAANIPPKRDGTSLKEWITENQGVPKVVETGVRTWLEENSLEASHWIAGLPEGDLKAAAKGELVRWLKEVGDVEGGDDWERNAAR